MRLARLDLTRYGRFTDHAIDFGAAPAAGCPDLHIVYGPNEAGKSTAFAAFLDLLFGIETRSRYNFLHPYPTMRIGGTLDLAGVSRDLVRLKRPQGGLFDAASQPVAEALIAGELGGIDRASYRTMFSLDDETLEAGGNSILASKGDLGELLFSSSAGLADLSQTLVELRREADGFHKPKKHGTALAGLKARLAALKVDKDRIDTFASTYAKLVAERDRTLGQYEAALKQRAATRLRMDEIGRQLGALPRLVELKRLREQHLPLTALPDAPAEWAVELPEIERRAIEGATELKSLGDAILALRADLDAITVDETALALASRLDGLRVGRARHASADEDLPDRHLVARTTAAQVNALMERLGRPSGQAPEALMPGAALVGILRGLIEARSGIAARLDTARDEQASAAEKLVAAETRLAGAGTSGQGLSRVAATMARLRERDHQARLRLVDRALPTLRETLAARLRDLKPWSGDMKQLDDLVLPDPAGFEALLGQAAEARARVDRAAETVERLSTEQAKLRAEIGALGTTTGIIGDGEAAALRAARDRAWSAHCARLDIGSAEAFEDFMRRDDIATGARFGGAADVARLRQIHLALATVDVDLTRAESAREAADRARGTVAAEIAATLRRIVPPLPDVGGSIPLGPWMMRRREALGAQAALRQAEREREAAMAEAADDHATLTAALFAADVPHEKTAAPERLLAAAQAALDREAANKGLRDQIETLRRDCALRAAALAKAVRAEADWSAAWADACHGCWLGEAGAMPSVEAVREVLKVLADLAILVEKQTDMSYRIAAMERDQGAYAADVLALAAGFGMAAAGHPVVDLDEAMQRRVGKAREDEAARRAILKQLNAAEPRRATLVAEIATTLKLKAAMTGLFGVGSLPEVAERLRDLARRDDLGQRIADAERDVATAVRHPDPVTAEARLEGIDRTGLEAEFGELEPRFDVEDARMRETHAQHARASDSLDAVGGDDAVARIELERQTVLLEIEDQARRFLRLHAGIAAAEQALRAYRDRHRSAMMERAARAFETISRGAYKGLAVQSDTQTEILMGVAADDSTKLVPDLSKGTRFQLYLALRIAGYHEFAAHRHVVPFVADDIMETFDDFRAEETFRLFGEMATKGQVIYLTHHRHLLDIARSVCPAVRIHELPAPLVRRAVG